MVAFQQIQEGSSKSSMLPMVVNTSSRSLKGYMGIKLHDRGIRGTPKPTQTPKYPDYTTEQDMGSFHSEISSDRSWLVVWSVQRAITDHMNTAPVQTDEHDEDISTGNVDNTPTGNDGPTANIHANVQFVQTWAAYNSVISDNERPLAQISTLPLIQAPAHECSTLLTILKHAQHITTEVAGQNRKKHYYPGYRSVYEGSRVAVS